LKSCRSFAPTTRSSSPTTAHRPLGELADDLAREHRSIRVIHHGKNLGYGAAVRSGLAASRFEYVCLTDGDDEYEVEDFRKLLKLRDRYDLIITFRYKKIYSNTRIFVSWVYNKLLRLLFRMPFRDVSTGLRMIRKSVIEDLALESTSPFVGAEIAIKAMLKGYAVGEVGSRCPRVFGKGATASFEYPATMWTSFTSSESVRTPTIRRRTGRGGSSMERLTSLLETDSPTGPETSPAIWKFREASSSVTSGTDTC
jgi:hypothetical protein